MAIVNVNRGGVDWKCITPSETPTWRMFYDPTEKLVMDLFSDTEESLTVDSEEAFEANTRQECIDKIDELGLIFIPEVER